MSKLKNVVIAFFALVVFMVTPAFPQGLAGCRNGMFVGSYTTLITFPDIWGDWTNLLNQTILQLNLHSDGTATQEFSGAPLIMLSSGTETPRVGSWTCRSDGKLVVTLIFARYFPTNDAVNHPVATQIPPPVDLLLGGHFRATYLFSVTDKNTLTRIQVRTRRYNPRQDPTDPNGGVLLPLNTDVLVFNRVVASDADLLAP